jgi:6-phosphogluconolactonase (cycloisomerase 2 family)
VVNTAGSGETSSPIGFIINGIPAFLYVANGSYGSTQTGSISGFSVDPNTGALTPVPGSPFPAGAHPSSLTSDPGGKYLYESNDKNGATTNDLFAFAIDPSTGVLTPVPGSPFTSGTETLSLSVDPTGEFLYAADSGGENNYPALPTTIAEFSINPADGALTSVTQVGACVPTSSDLANYVFADPTGGFLFASTVGSICSYSISSSGTLQPASGSPFPVNPSPPVQDVLFPRAVSVDPLGKFLYVADGEVSAFSIASSGTLTQLSGSPYVYGTQDVAASSLVVDPLDRFLWVDHLYVEIDGFGIDSNTGALSYLGTALSSPNPQLALTSAPNTSATPMAADPSGKFFYVLTQPGAVAQNFSITGFAIDPTTGKLAALPNSPLPLPANTTPATVTITVKPQ